MRYLKLSAKALFIPAAVFALLALALLDEREQQPLEDDTDTDLVTGKAEALRLALASGYNAATFN